MSTLNEVANEANVSATTVSRVINDSDKVNPDTRDRVLKAMRKLNYRPSRVAQRLRGKKGRSKLLGVIIPDIQNQYYSNIARGIEDVAYNKDYDVILCNSDENPDRERFYLDVLQAESVDGVILPPIHQYGTAVEGIIDTGIPVVCVDRKFAKQSVDTVVINNKKGAYSATSHLIDLNHKRIGIITSSPQFSSFQERQEGYEQALKDHDIPVNNSLIKEGDPRNSETARKLTLELLQLDSAPTALFITNNLMTLGVLKALKQQNFVVPDDISIVMFDDMPWAQIMTPPLTVVRQPGYEMGRRAAELIFQRIADSERETVEVTMNPELIVRKSTGGYKRDNER